MISTENIVALRETLNDTNRTTAVQNLDMKGTDGKH